MNALHGPIVCTATPDYWARLLGGPLGMRRVGRNAYHEGATAALFGVRDAAAIHEVYETPGTDAGVHVVTLTPAAGTPLRHPARGTDVDALKVIDFYARDLGAAIAALTGAGFAPARHVARYALAQGEIAEAHLWTPDGVVCAVLSGPDELFGPLVRAKDSVLSEVMGVSAPVSDAQAAHAFYRQGLGLDVVADYAFQSESFARLLGRDEAVQIAARNYGDAPARPFIGIVDYGALRGTSASLRGQARFDRCGLVGVALRCDDAVATYDALTSRYAADGVCPPHTTAVAPWGPARCAAVLAGHGVWHMLIGAPADERE